MSEVHLCHIKFSSCFLLLLRNLIDKGCLFLSFFWTTFYALLSLLALVLDSVNLLQDSGELAEVELLGVVHDLLELVTLADRVRKESLHDVLFFNSSLKEQLVIRSNLFEFLQRENLCFSDLLHRQGELVCYLRINFSLFNLTNVF